MISFAQAGCHAVTGLLQTRSRRALPLTHTSSAVLMSSKCRSEEEEEEEEGLAFLAGGAGCAASSTFPWAAAANNCEGLKWSWLLLTRSNDLSWGCSDNRGFNQNELTSLTSSHLFSPYLDSSKEFLWQEPAAMPWRSCWPASPEDGEQPALSLNYKFLRVVTHVPQNMALSLESLFKSF